LPYSISYTAVKCSIVLSPVTGIILTTRSVSISDEKLSPDERRHGQVPPLSKDNNKSFPPPPPKFFT